MSIDNTHRECANLHVHYFLNKLTDWSYDKETILIECSKLDCLLYISKYLKNFHMGLKIFFNQKNEITKTFPISLDAALKFPVYRKIWLIK